MARSFRQISLDVSLSLPSYALPLLPLYSSSLIWLYSWFLMSVDVAKHEQDGDAVDPNLAQRINNTPTCSLLSSLVILHLFPHFYLLLTIDMKSTSPAGPPMQTCSHPFHMAWWHTPPEQPIGEFYNRSYKCKRCCIIFHLRFFFR